MFWPPRRNRPKRQLPVRVVWWLAILFSLGVWVGVILAARTVAANLLDAVNREVNHVDTRTQPLEVGGDNDGVFDCEDYARLKRRRLIEAGVSRADLQLWAVTTWRGERHMVLEARGVILDSLTRRALPRDQVTYYSHWTPRR